MRNTNIDTDSKEALSGILKHVIHRDEQTGYTVATLENQAGDIEKVVGSMVKITEGSEVKLIGKHYFDKTHGWQFNFHDYEITLPASMEGISKYLGSGLIRGLGPKMAKRVVSEFHEDTLHILDSDPDQLLSVEGIGKKKLETIKDSWAENNQMRTLMIFLKQYDVGTSNAFKIYKVFGSRAIEEIKHNPYCIITEVKGIGFKTADAMAQKMGMGKNSEFRIKAGIIHTINVFTSKGNTYLPMEEFLTLAQTLLEVPKEIIPPCIDDLDRQYRLIVEDDRVYDKWLYRAEENIAKNLNLLQTTKCAPIKWDESMIGQIEQELNIPFDDNQKEAIRSALKEKISIITGGPGTGKSSIQKAILQIAESDDQEIICTAPTCGAAKRMKIITGHEAANVYRLLKYSRELNGFRHNGANPLETDLVLLDEASMMDAIITDALIEAIPLAARLVIIGDIDQLPSVGPGSILKDMINSGQFKTTRLTHNYRQAKSGNSLISENAHRINNGEFPIINNKANTDFYFVQTEDPNVALNQIITLCEKRIPGHFGFDALHDIQVLTPKKKGVTGTINLNKELQKVLVPRNAAKVEYGQRMFMVGDKVLQKDNNYEKDVFNGEIGHIESIDPERQQVMIKFDDKTVAYDFKELNQIILAWASTIHKSQGSEYPVVIIPVLNEHYIMLQRNLIYTGVTRGKELVIIVGSKKALYMAIKNDKTQKRYSSLEERLAA